MNSSSIPSEYVKKILQARVYEVAEETPIDDARLLSARLRNAVWLKREDLQPVFSFKCRGAYNKVASLSDEEKARGVIAASAGNHAQGLALAAEKLGLKAVIVMPKTTPDIKVNAVTSRGAEAVLHGDTFDQAYAHSQKLMQEHGYVYVHPYDDPEVIAGQGTVAMEILNQITGSLDAIFVPVGGGGLIAGISAYVKYVHPEIKIIGVESVDSACLLAALDADARVVLSQVGLFADGVAVAQIGEETFRVARECVDEVITCDTDEICAAIKDIFEDTRSVAEPAGALAVAGLKKYVQREQWKNKSVLAIVSGANMNFDRLRHIAERTELGEKREAIFAVAIPETPGSFRQFCEMLGQRNITEFNYRYADNKLAHVFVGVQLRHREERQELIEHLRANNYSVVDMSEDEMAKLHVRYMVGGHAAVLANEIIYRFEFPERPGALMNFLNKLGQRWSISLFHYRNHGAAFGRVLVGLQVPDKHKTEFEDFLEDLGFPFVDESTNLAYKLFLR